MEMRTMRKTFLAAAFFPMLILAGCYVQSLNPFYTNESRTDFPQIVGKWQMFNEQTEQKGEQQKKTTPWEIEQNKMMTYDEENVAGEVMTVYFKVNENVFVDATAGTPNQKTNGYWGAGIHPVHTICKVELEGDKLYLIPADYQAVKKMAEEGKTSLKFIESSDKNSVVIYISKTEEWLEFLKTNGNNQEIFNKAHALNFRKVK